MLRGQKNKDMKEATSLGQEQGLKARTKSKASIAVVMVIKEGLIPPENMELNPAVTVVSSKMSPDSEGVRFHPWSPSVFFFFRRPFSPPPFASVPTYHVFK